MAEIYLAGGCFWGLEEYFSRINGVTATTVGYANGKTLDTNYQEVKATDHLSVNKQGNDVGRQYRTGIYYTNDADLPVIERIMAEQESLFGQKLAVEVEPLDNYVLAEEYHQDYLKKNPGGYCHINVDDAYKPLA